MSTEELNLEELTSQSTWWSTSGPAMVTKIKYLEYNGQEFFENDRVIISGHNSKFFFRSYERNELTGEEWVNVFEDNYHVRSFALSKIVVKKTKKSRKKNAKIEYAVCATHPLYTARRRPRTGCAVCFAAYESRRK